MIEHDQAIADLAWRLAPPPVSRIGPVQTAMDCFLHLLALPLATPHEAAERGMAGQFWQCALEKTAKKHKRLLPHHDVSLLLANLALAELGDVALLDWELLPVACLLAASGRGVFLPASGDESKRAQAIAALAGLFSGNVQCGFPAAGSFIIGCNALQRAQEDHEFFQTLEMARGAAMLEADKALRDINLGKIRARWAQSGLLTTIFQPLKPRSYGEERHPAILITGAKMPGASVAMAHARAAWVGAGGLPPAKCLAAIAEPANSGVTLDDLAAADWNLDTRHWLVTRPHRNSVGLVAEVLRCDSVLCVKGETEPPPGAMPIKVIAGAQMRERDGLVNRLLARDAYASADIDPKYWLRKGDILMVFRGHEYQLGTVALVTEDMEQTAPAPILYIIRAKNYDPVCLYYWLKQEKIRQILLEGLKVSPSMCAYRGRVRNLPFQACDSAQIAETEKLQVELEAKWAMIDRLQAAARAIGAEISVLARPAAELDPQ